MAYLRPRCEYSERVDTAKIYDKNNTSSGNPDYCRPLFRHLSVLNWFNNTCFRRFLTSKSMERLPLPDGNFYAMTCAVVTVSTSL